VKIAFLLLSFLLTSCSTLEKKTDATELNEGERIIVMRLTGNSRSAAKMPGAYKDIDIALRDSLVVDDEGKLSHNAIHVCERKDSYPVEKKGIVIITAPKKRVFINGLCVTSEAGHSNLYKLLYGLNLEIPAQKAKCEYVGTLHVRVNKKTHQFSYKIIDDLDKWHGWYDDKLQNCQLTKNLMRPMKPEEIEKIIATGATP
jgi:hypothetical protein